jgi:hypothetical protein
MMFQLRLRMQFGKQRRVLLLLVCFVAPVGKVRLLLDHWTLVISPDRHEVRSNQARRRAGCLRFTWCLYLLHYAALH